MSKFALLFSQSYISKLKAKSFYITTIIMLLAVFGFFMWPTISSWFSSADKPLKILVIDQTKADAGTYFKSGKRLVFKSSSDMPEQAGKQILKGKADAALVLNMKKEGGLNAELRTKKPLQLNDQQLLEQDVQSASQLFTIQQLKLTPVQAARIMNQSINLKQKVIAPSADKGKTSKEKTTATLVSYAIAFIIYIFVLSYLSIISSEIAAEKDSRIMEIIISSSSPVVHLLSRVAGVLALAMTQFAVMIGAALLMAHYFQEGKYWDLLGGIFSTLSAGYVIFAILFFFLACVLYTLIGAVLGSLVNKVQDVGQAIMPVTFLLMIGFFVAISGMSNPDTLIIKIFSYIPFTASMIMPMRIGATDMGLWEAFLSIAILILTVIGMFVFSLRFYRGSVLTYTNGSFITKIKQAILLSR
ncbi:ABC transporter permease [Sporolactobacillus laevolacticus]|uniref:Sodium ABC transporter permease n=1 Tax=Sporolactobacillus laevolacticus DSM 442 TaxID=1395513 RepID=V6IWT8_9BACL|nr:ABC transporter permease [Sporolactobacillus laevolacticus]EST11742.1 sodium ABC transporter permease [Sporolactobacillus laevolacticus DSM 442]